MMSTQTERRPVDLPRVSPPASPGARDSRRRQRGLFLLEVVVALAITASAGAATLGMISVSAIGSLSALDRTTASVLATSQAEEIQVAPFVATPGEYPAVPSPPGFEVSNRTVPFPGGDEAIQTVYITVTKEGEPILTVEIVKVDR